jgi:hypothetical protein
LNRAESIYINRREKNATNASAIYRKSRHFRRSAFDPEGRVFFKYEERLRRSEPMSRPQPSLAILATCIFGDGEPITLKFADAIGEILTAGPVNDVPPLPFSHYI